MNKRELKHSLQDKISERIDQLKIANSLQLESIGNELLKQEKVFDKFNELRELEKQEKEVQEKISSLRIGLNAKDGSFSSKLLRFWNWEEKLQLLAMEKLPAIKKYLDLHESITIELAITPMKELRTFVNKVLSEL